MPLFILLPIAILLYSCAPLRPLGPETTPPIAPNAQGEKDGGKKDGQGEQKDSQDGQKDGSDVAERNFIDVGIGFEKGKPKIECQTPPSSGQVGGVIGKNCKYGAKNYRGEVITVSSDTGFTIINRISIEDYLKGVVPHEIGKLGMDGFEALKAQAVAARTYAYHHLGSRKTLGFDVFADTRDQVYNGMDGEDSLVNAAISETRDLVIKYNGKLIESFYHSTCGGTTDSPEVWGQESKPYLVSVSDLNSDGRAFCSLSKYSNWEEKFGDAELVENVRKNATSAKADKVFSFNKIEQIFITEKFASGRVKRLAVFTDKGSFEVFGDRTRWLFARNGKILPSTLFEISHSGKEWSIKGSGYGHGIGMCQMGAIARAKAGQNFEEILKAYYSGVNIQK